MKARNPYLIQTERIVEDHNWTIIRTYYINKAGIKIIVSEKEILDLSWIMSKN